jgi:hypothetical protein
MCPQEPAIRRGEFLGTGNVTVEGWLVVGTEGLGKRAINRANARSGRCMGGYRSLYSTELQCRDPCAETPRNRYAPTSQSGGVWFVPDWLPLLPSH